MSIFASGGSAMSDADRRALIIFLIIAVIVFIIIALIGFAVRKTMAFQMKRADNMMYNVTVAHVVNSPKEFKRFGKKKNNRLFYRQSLIPFLIAVVGLVIWIITCAATDNWGINPFHDISDLFFAYDWEEEGLFVNVFGLSLLSRWPSVTHTPEFLVEHIPSYLCFIIWIVAIVYYAVVCQAYLSRHVMILRRARTVFEKSLEDYKAARDIQVKGGEPPPPSD